ncbi:hypothetical protein [Brucella endophytica]|uniref:hypothetical protein n=1 Tax=Brucella endophytica TaxID=1963359 RepID=UPI001F487452|nr:hypothetical protein [Brucella endophytica]
MMTIDDKIQSVIGLGVSCDTVTLFDSLTSQTMTVANRCDELCSALEAFAGLAAFWRFARRPADMKTSSWPCWPFHPSRRCRQGEVLYPLLRQKGQD